MEYFRGFFVKALIQKMTLSFVIIVMCHAPLRKISHSNRSDFKLRMEE